MAYVQGTKSFVLNQLHVMLQEAQNNDGNLYDGLLAIGLASIDEALGMIEEVRDNDETPA